MKIKAKRTMARRAMTKGKKIRRREKKARLKSKRR
jgi:hypothetical protein